MDLVFESDPGDEEGAERDVEKAFVGDGEDYEGRGEGEEDDDKAVEVVVVWLGSVQERY